MDRVRSQTPHPNAVLCRPTPTAVGTESCQSGPVARIRSVQLCWPAAMRIERGAIVGLLGPNGSGKTTLIRMLSTLLRPTAGQALVGGFDIRRQPADVRRCIGLTGQFAAVDEFLTGRENIRMMGRLAGMSAHQASARADELLSAFGLQDSADRHLTTYSGGMRRRFLAAVGGRSGNAAPRAPGSARLVAPTTTSASRSHKPMYGCAPAHHARSKPPR